MAKANPTLAGVGPSLAGTGSTSVQLWPSSVQIWAKLDQRLPNMSRKSVRFGATSTQVGPSSALHARRSSAPPVRVSFESPPTPTPSHTQRTQSRRGAGHRCPGSAHRAIHCSPKSDPKAAVWPRTDHSWVGVGRRLARNTQLALGIRGPGGPRRPAEWGQVPDRLQILRRIGPSKERGRQNGAWRPSSALTIGAHYENVWFCKTCAPRLGQNRQNLPNSPKFGRIRTDVGRTRAKFGRNRRRLSKSGPRWAEIPCPVVPRASESLARRPVPTGPIERRRKALPANSMAHGPVSPCAKRLAPSAKRGSRVARIRPAPPICCRARARIGRNRKKHGQKGAMLVESGPTPTEHLQRCCQVRAQSRRLRRHDSRNPAEVGRDRRYLAQHGSDSAETEQVQGDPAPSGGHEAENGLRFQRSPL